MPAIWKQTWSIDSSIADQVNGMSMPEINAFFVGLKSVDRLNINARLAQLYQEGKTSSEQFAWTIDKTALMMVRYRQFVDYPSALEHKQWHDSFSSVYPVDGQALFTLVSHEVLDNMSLDQLAI